MIRSRACAEVEKLIERRRLWLTVALSYVVARLACQAILFRASRPLNQELFAELIIVPVAEIALLELARFIRRRAW
jgi:hypothetical protein